MLLEVGHGTTTQKCRDICTTITLILRGCWKCETWLLFSFSTRVWAVVVRKRSKISEIANYSVKLRRLPYVLSKISEVWSTPSEIACVCPLETAKIRYKVWPTDSWYIMTNVQDQRVRGQDNVMWCNSSKNYCI